VKTDDLHHANRAAQFCAAATLLTVGPAGAALRPTAPPMNNVG